MPRPSRGILPAMTVARVAVAASVDPKTVTRYLRGGRVLETTRLAVEAALTAAGHGRLVRAAEVPAGNGAAA